MESRFKVGQQVRISANTHEDMSSPGVNQKMMEMIGKVFTVKEVMQSDRRSQDGHWYILGNGWTWSDEMLEPVIITKDEAFQALLDGRLSDAEYEKLMKVIK